MKIISFVKVMFLIISREWGEYHLPCTSIVFCPVGALTASWSKVMISPESLNT